MTYALLLLLTVAPADAAQTAEGWRGDGDGRDVEATAPAAWTPEDHVVWRQPLPGPGNAAPVRVGPHVCVTYEPTGLACFDAATGRPAWSATNEVVDALPDTLGTEVRGQLAQVAAWEASLKALQKDYAAARREARRGGDALERLNQITTELATVRASLDGVAPYRAVGSDPVIGWASATPVSDGERLYAVFAQGVVACYDANGVVLWRRWLGPRTVEMRGYTGQNTASPRIAGDVLVVGYHHLRGLDLDTGATRWDAGPFADYGTPAVATVGEREVVLTGDGRMVDARDGTVHHRALGDLWYTGPLVHNDRVFFVGTTAKEAQGSAWPTFATAWTLAPQPQGIEATQDWTHPLPTRHRYYATPVVFRDMLVTLTKEGEAVALDLATGAVRHTFQVPYDRVAESWTSPMAVGDVLVTMDDRGFLRVYDDLDAAPVRTARLERGLAPPLFDGDHAWYRGQTTLWHLTSKDTP